MSTRRALGLALATALSASALAGCSQGDDKKKEAPAAKDAISKSQDTVKKYAGLSMKTTGKLDGQTGDISVYGDAKGTTQDLKGKVGGEDLEFLYVNDTAYSKAGKKFYEKHASSLPSSTINKVADKWIEAPAKSSDKEDLATPEFIEVYTDDSSAATKGLLDTKEKVTEDKVGDRDAWKIVSSDKKTTVWVSADDKYDILKTRNVKVKSIETDDSDGQTIEFYDQGKTHELKAPSDTLSAKDVVKSGQ